MCTKSGLVARRKPVSSSNGSTFIRTFYFDPPTHLYKIHVCPEQMYVKRDLFVDNLFVTEPRHCIFI